MKRDFCAAAALFCLAATPVMPAAAQTLPGPDLLIADSGGPGGAVLSEFFGPAGAERAALADDWVTFTKFGLSFAVPSGFTVKADTATGLIAVDRIIGTSKPCIAIVFLRDDNDLSNTRKEMVVEPLPDRALGPDVLFKGITMHGRMNDLQISGFAVASFDPLVDGRYLIFALNCEGDDAEKASRMAQLVLPGLRYDGSGGTAAAGPAAQTAADPAIELAFWDAIKDSNDPADFAAYLDQFPGGAFAALARNRMKRLADAALAPAASSPPPVADMPAESAFTGEAAPPAVAAAAPEMRWGQPVRNKGWWIIMGSFPTEPWQRQQGDFDAMQSAAAPCGIAIFNDLSGKFDGFRPGLNIFVAGAFESKAAADQNLPQVRACFPDAYVKYGEYLGE